MIVDTHVAGVSRIRDPKLADLIMKDKFFMYLRQLNPSGGREIQTPARLESYVEAMGDLGVDRLVIHSVGYYPETCRALNNATKSLCDKYPEQLAGFATIPLWYPNEAVAELDRAAKDLEMKGLKICPGFKSHSRRLQHCFG